MKFTIAMLSLILSANVFANAFAVTSKSSILTSASPSLSSSSTSAANQKVQAETVVNDAQNMLHTGEVSIFLSQKIQETQAQNLELSDAEALDVLIDSAYSILSK